MAIITLWLKRVFDTVFEESWRSTKSHAMSSFAHTDVALVLIYIKAHCWSRKTTLDLRAWCVFQGSTSSQLRCFYIYYKASSRWELWALLISIKQQNFLKSAVSCQAFLCNLIRPSISKVRSYKLIFLYSLDTVEWFLV